jgi:hypothetical protein
MTLANTAPAAAAGPVRSAAEGEQLVTHLVQIMDALLGTVEEETRLVRDGKLRAAAMLAQPKAELAQLYVADVNRLKVSQSFLNQTAPGMVEDLKKRHDLFRALLQINLTVLATAHAVSEGIIRGVSSELAKKHAPQTYGASGRTVAAPRTSYQPMAVSRSL